ncbi:ATP-dependent helicase HrpB [Novosphingobium album (ex Liu et al. 2023)]|uniref:RNA helicase n=1 Tax=Novosphingobium album (ex Liu et al. 2023) TaxID=3031130 RepID=A0ABT5WQQ3_9SPHN|nr:ATP-dependent helicase HrpB [Novosphingobium album (ex Liu et al. 2023)]MDE8652091.1 ATP-dependent helicase HrpB [Novosphingobium album (ex Liu et al. 2023)]
MSDLPIHAVLPDLLAALRARAGAVLIAPPGAGKTTAVAPALLGEDWCTGTVILLSPRRVAARAAAERMADMLGEQAGETIGYVTRLDTRRSAKTRVLVMTEAIFVATVLDDPELAGISAVLFDEAHERHLDSDLGLALAIESQQVLRPDLRLLVMSATIDGARFARLLAGAPVIESAGKAHPLAIRWLGASPEARIEDAMTSAVLTAWREEAGDILAFLPGVREIERTAERLAERLPSALILPLHGQCDPAAQRAAIRRDAQGRRRIVLATAIAETSLTLDGVAVVVDAGLSRRAEFDKAAGVTRLVTHRASRASAAQRAGRAARQGPGVAYRLWEEAAHPGRPEFDPPEIETSDLAPLTLALAQWGAGDPTGMAWLDPPPPPALAAARGQLEALGALDGEGRITAFGRKVASLPMDPAQAATVLRGAERGAADVAARLVLLLQERGLGGRGEDLGQRLARWNADRSSRAQAARKLAEGWARRAQKRMAPAASAGRTDEASPGLLLALGRPDMVARRRDASGETWLSAGGRGYMLDPASPLATSEWLVIGDAQGQAKGARILAAVPLEPGEVERGLGERIERRSVLRWNAAEARIEARLERRLGAITLASGPDPAPDHAALAAFAAARLREQGLGLLPFSKASLALCKRARYAGIAALADEALLAELEDWAGPLLGRRFDTIDQAALHEALRGRLGWDDQQRLERLAPAEFVSPAGTHHAIDYEDEAGPCVEVRVQALFGLDRHPDFGQPPQPLLLKLTSPAGRPIQATRDLPGFWRGSWREVQREMKGRYPRHRWPDEPWAEDPSLKTRNAFEAGRR